MIRWTFYFDQGSLNCNVTNEDSDREIEKIVSECSGIVWIPGHPESYVNLDHVKAITREIVVPELITENVPVTVEATGESVCCAT